MICSSFRQFISLQILIYCSSKCSVCFLWRLFLGSSADIRIQTEGVNLFVQKCKRCLLVIFDLVTNMSSITFRDNPWIGKIFTGISKQIVLIQGIIRLRSRWFYCHSSCQRSFGMPWICGWINVVCTALHLCCIFSCLRNWLRSFTQDSC